VSLVPEDLERKLVAQRRGGYCFEQNLLLKAALEALGAEVDLFLARVRLGAEPGVTRPRTGSFVDVETSNWWTSTHPLSPFAPGWSWAFRRVPGRGPR
jgi:N-hydroxyarylamine O-acetyltransferase